MIKVVDKKYTKIQKLQLKNNTTKYVILYNNQINARALIGQSAMVYCAGKPTEKSRVF